MSSNSGGEHIVADRYVLRRELGRGGMGVVWEAFDPSLDRVVAIKQVLLPDHFTDEERADAHARVRREAQSAARISHPSVITIHDVFQFGGDPWVVMELVEGGSLQERLNEHGPLDLETAASVAESLLKAVRAADAAGVLHRDIKPGNIMMSSDGRVILTDFGIATMEGGPSITRTGALIGSPEYMPPERLEGGPAEHRGDLWSIGVTLFAAVEGTSPFRRDSITAAIAAVMSAELPPMTRAGWLRPVIEGLLERDPDRRLTPEAALDLLRGSREDTGGAGGPDEATGSGTGPNTPGRAVGGGAAAGGAAGAAAGGAAGAAAGGATTAGGTPAGGPAWGAAGNATAGGAAGGAGPAGPGGTPHPSHSGGYAAPSGGYAAPGVGYRSPADTRPSPAHPGPPHGGGPRGPSTPFPGHGRPPAYGPVAGHGAGHPSGGHPGGGGPPTGHLRTGGTGGSRSGSTSRILLGVGAGTVALLLIAVATVVVVMNRTDGSGRPLAPTPDAAGPAGGEAEPGELDSGVSAGPPADDDDDDAATGDRPAYDSLETFDSEWFSVGHPQGWYVDDSGIDSTIVAIQAEGGNHQVWMSGWTEPDFTGTSAEFLESTDGGTDTGGESMPDYTQLDLAEVGDHDLGAGWDVARVEAEFTNESWPSRERRFWSYAMSTDYQDERVFYLMSVNVPVSDAEYYADLPEDVFETFTPHL
ncbi:serine/threonine-protein kinase [Nocardiopsis sp. NRRL B-16309]|uniref:serine/threonine-protein kinase n=1 Tax=Nocardiopsis sp. NRRL B-16309 TaxID=1519494 RepID=UPI0006AF4890|nr:serine/threonine-protein kinase [Nocardiopsis sp. NRRL B-16309]KOX18297.1 serine/threonine protein kinase [Nocardiopsis sp. NRRL B-16309]